MLVRGNVYELAKWENNTYYSLREGNEDPLGQNVNKRIIITLWDSFPHFVMRLNKHLLIIRFLSLHFYSSEKKREKASNFCV